MIGKKQFKTAAPEDFMSLAIAESEWFFTRSSWRFNAFIFALFVTNNAEYTGHILDDSSQHNITFLFSNVSRRKILLYLFI
jgi:hypothetical protein